VRDVPERGEAICIKNCTFWNVARRWKCSKCFHCCDNHLKGVNYRIWIAFLPFLNKNSNVAKNLVVIEKNRVHFLIQQTRNIQNQLTDLKQLKKSFFVYTSVIKFLTGVDFTSLYNRQSWNLQAMLTGETLKRWSKNGESRKLKTEINKSIHKLRQAKIWKITRSQIIAFTETEKLSGVIFRETNHVDVISPRWTLKQICLLRGRLAGLLQKRLWNKH